MSTDLPDGLSGDFPVQPFPQKNSASRLTQIKFISMAVPAQRGAFRDRHKRWAGDAVDAAASCAELGRWSEQAQTNDVEADGEVVWS
jgi:hypothetical protein